MAQVYMFAEWLGKAVLNPASAAQVTRRLLVLRTRTKLKRGGTGRKRRRERRRGKVK